MNPYRQIFCGCHTRALEEEKTRSFLILGKARAILLDSGLACGDLTGEIRAITNLPVELVHTHADWDHIAADGQFEQVTIHKGDWPLYCSRIPRPPRHRFVEDGDTLELGGVELTVLHLPGHTPGSIALLDRANRRLYAGDTVQRAPVYLFGEGRNVSRYVESLERLVSLASEFDTIFACHGPIQVPSGYLAELLDGARRLRDGLLSPVRYEHPYPAPLYRWGRARFLYVKSDVCPQTQGP